MKTLIFNGSPRKNGDTMALVHELIKHLDGEYKILNAYDCTIKPCIDCRYCWKNKGCSQNDQMQEVYRYIQQCDAVVIASPVHFSELTGQLLAVMSRLQTYWCARFLRNENPIDKKKKGAILLVGGGNGSMKKAIETAESLLHTMNAESVGTAYSHHTDTISPKDDPSAMEAVRKIALQFNECI